MDYSQSFVLQTVLLMQEMEPDSGLKPPRNVAVEVKNATMAWSAVGDVEPKMPGVLSGD